MAKKTPQSSAKKANGVSAKTDAKIAAGTPVKSSERAVLHVPSMK